jgi:GTP-binding protein
MIFLDEAVIAVASGDGGSGCVSFRRARYKPRGGPDGGDGGNGGHVILRATKQLATLADYGSRKTLRAPNGEPGRGEARSGKNGQDLILEVPPGTLVQDHATGKTLADLTRDGQELLLIPGGKGGRGNQHFSTSANRAPRFAQLGRPGQEKKLKLSLKCLADIGLVGRPNTGKSTLLSRLTTARPKIGPYPFTTRTPNLGVMEHEDYRTLVVADIPGLVAGASEGRGLGLRFLKHIERTKLILHLLDITYQPDGDMLEDLKAVRREMLAYSPLLSQKPEIILINKMDVYSPECRDLGSTRGALKEMGLESLPISAVTGQNLEALRQLVFEKCFH